jgi:hypothetical protein
MFDRLKEYVVYAGLAVGSVRAGDDVWLLAVLALGLQTVRHAVDSAYAVTPAAVRAKDEGVERRATGDRRRWHWARKVAILPIGERWLLISVLAAVSTPRVVLVVLIAAGALAGAYMLIAQARRALRPTAAAPAPEATAALLRMCDAGPLLSRAARAVGRGRSLPPRWGWLLPPALRAAEYATVVVAGLLCLAGVGPVAFGYLLTVIWHHYDAGHRSRHRVAESGLTVVAGLGGFEVRTLVVVVLAVLGAGVYTVGLAAMAVLLAVVAVVRGLDLRKQLKAADQESAGRSGNT